MTNAPTKDEQPFDWAPGPKEGPLGSYRGEKPAAPDWFKAAIAVEPERGFIEVDAAQIETLAWGERGKPGLLLMHGNSAHADWWSHLAPLLAPHYRVAAFSWSGMGNSDWRKAYSTELHAREALETAKATGLYDAGKPVVAAHSFGGHALRHLAVKQPDQIAGGVIIDSRTDFIPRTEPDGTRRGPPIRTKPNNVYPTFEAALARFRLAPPQPCENLYLLDHIARTSLMPAPMPDGSGEKGWTWKFDPFLFQNFEFTDAAYLDAKPGCPMAAIWGARSLLMDHARLREIRAAGQFGPMVEIPDAGHHVMLDQPLALVASLMALLEVWPHRT